MTLNLSVPTDEKNDAWNLGTGHLFPTCFLPQSTVFRLSLSSQHYYNRAGCWRRFKRWKSMKEANTMRERNKRDKISQNTNNRDFGKGDKLPIANYLEKDNKTKNSLTGGKII